VVVDDPTAAMEVFEPGDVIITSATESVLEQSLVDAGALVTAAGGLVLHAAITARELGIPAVIGDASACVRLRTGVIVTLDPVRACATVGQGWPVRVWIDQDLCTDDGPCTDHSPDVFTCSRTGSPTHGARALPRSRMGTPVSSRSTSVTRRLWWRRRSTARRVHLPRAHRRSRSDGRRHR
jgi:phosphohistidine swiveling domain-containing protein